MSIVRTAKINSSEVGKYLTLHSLGARLISSWWEEMMNRLDLPSELLNS
jgi:hypothetical protein